MASEHHLNLIIADTSSLITLILAGQAKSIQLLRSYGYQMAVVQAVREEVERILTIQPHFKDRLDSWKHAVRTELVAVMDGEFFRNRFGEKHTPTGRPASLMP